MLFNTEIVNILMQSVSQSWAAVFITHGVSHAVIRLCTRINKVLRAADASLLDVMPDYNKMLAWAAVDDPKVVILAGPAPQYKWRAIVGGTGSVDAWAEQAVSVIPRTVSKNKEISELWTQFVDFVVDKMRLHWPAIDVLGKTIPFDIDAPVATNRRLFHSLAQKHGIKWNLDAVCIDDDPIDDPCESLVNPMYDSVGGPGPMSAATQTAVAQASARAVAGEAHAAAQATAGVVHAHQRAPPADAIDDLDVAQPKRELIVQPVAQKIYIFTDGACTGNGTPKCIASWAYAIVVGEELHHADSGLCDGQHSNNRGELTAILKALTYFKNANIDGDVYVVSDSQYSINCITKWYPKWVLDYATDSKKNIDLLSQLAAVGIACQYVHVRSHLPQPKTKHEKFLWKWNDYVDKAAQRLLIGRRVSKK